MSRTVFEVRWNRAEKLWFVRRRDISGGVYAYETTKRKTVKIAVSLCRDHWASGKTVELVIYRQDGRIGKGHDSRMTYGKDPRRKKG